MKILFKKYELLKYSIFKLIPRANAETYDRK